MLMYLTPELTSFTHGIKYNYVLNSLMFYEVCKVICYCQTMNRLINFFWNCTEFICFLGSYNQELLRPNHHMALILARVCVKSASTQTQPVLLTASFVYITRSRTNFALGRQVSATLVCTETCLFLTSNAVMKL